MKNIIKKALLMALLSFLCGTQGYAVKLNSKGQKMVSRLVLRNFRTGEISGEVIFTYDDKSNLVGVKSTDGNLEILYQKRGKDIIVEQYRDGKLLTNYQYTVITDDNGNITEVQDDCIGTDGSKSRQKTTYAYNFCPELDDYVMCSSDSWSLGVMPNGEVHPATMVNGQYVREHDVTQRTYENGNMQITYYHYCNDKLMESMGGYFELLYSEDIDDTNINMTNMFGGFSSGNTGTVLMMTEWVKRKTKNLAVGVDDGKGGIAQQAEYSRDTDGNIVEMRQQISVRSGFLLNIEYVE